MKIGLVLDSFDPRRGGVEQWTWQFADRLLKRGHEVHVVAGGFESGGPTLPIVPHTFPLHRRRLDRVRAAEELLRDLDLDVVHDMGFGWQFDVLQPHGGSRRASFEQNLLLVPGWMRPLKRMAAAVLPRYREFRQLNARQYTLGAEQRLLALSQMVARDFARFHRVPSEQMPLVYNGVDVQRFSPDHRAVHRAAVRSRLGIRDEVLFVIIAHNLKLKGVPALLRAAACLAEEESNFHVAVVGGKRNGAMRRLLGSLKIAEQVTFVGAVDDAVPYYAAADVYVQPTFYDPCSLVVLEALASGLPVITSRFNGAGELMTPGEHGFIVDDPADHLTLAGRMAELMEPGVRRTMGRAARTLALQHTFDDNVDRIVAVYEEIVHAKSQPARRVAA